MEEKQRTNLLQSAAWIIAVLSIAVILALVLGAGRQNPAAQEGTSEATEGTAEAVTEVAATEAPCMVTAENSDVQMFPGPPGAAPTGSQGLLMIGQSAPVKTIDDTQNDNVWYEIEFGPPDGSAPTVNGWVSGNEKGVTVTGGCDSVARVTGQTAASACNFVAEGSDFKVYDAPDGMNSVGMIFIGSSTPIYSFTSDSAGQRWIEVDFEGQHGWISSAEGNFKLDGDCLNVPIVGISSSGGTFVGGYTGCDLTAGEGGNPVFSTPQESGDALIGRLDQGISAQILGQAQASNTNGGLQWYQIGFQGAVGWTYVTGRETLSGTCDAIPLLDVPPATPTPVGGEAGSECRMTFAHDTDLYSAPDVSSDVITTLPAGTEGIVMSYVKLPEGMWHQVAVGNTVSSFGFVQSEIPPVGLSGDCGNIPAYQEESPQVAFTGQPDYQIDVSGEVGTERQFSETLPSSDGKSQHILEIYVGIPQADGNDGRRTVEYTIDCQDTDNAGVLGFHWGWWDSTDLPFACGDKTVSDGLLWSESTVHFILIGDPQHPLTYVITIKVSAYP